MNKIDSNRVINGTYGEVWFDDEYLAEISSFKASVEIKYEDVPQVGKLIAGKKMTSAEGKGELKLKHVRTNISKKIAEMVKNGKTPSFKVVGKLSDPDALGAERVALYECKPDKVNLMDWELGKLTEESYGFSFEDWDMLDSINA